MLSGINHFPLPTLSAFNSYNRVASQASNSVTNSVNGVSSADNNIDDINETNNAPQPLVGVLQNNLTEKLKKAKNLLQSQIPKTVSGVALEGITLFPLAILEVLWGLSELSSGLLSKFIYTLTSTEEVFASGNMAYTTWQNKECLENRIKEIDYLLEKDGNYADINEEQKRILNAVLNNDLQALVHFEGSKNSNYLLSYLQGGVSILLGIVTIMKVTGKDKHLTRRLEENKILKVIENSKQKMFSGFPKHIQPIAEALILSLPMFVLGWLKHNLSKQFINNDLSSSFEAESIANNVCGTEGLLNIAEVFANKFPALKGLVRVIDPILSFGMFWNYLSSTLGLVAHQQNQKQNDKFSAFNGLTSSKFKSA